MRTSIDWLSLALASARTTIVDRRVARIDAAHTELDTRPDLGPYRLHGLRRLRATRSLHTTGLIRAAEAGAVIAGVRDAAPGTVPGLFAPIVADSPLTRR